MKRSFLVQSYRAEVEQLSQRTSIDDVAQPSRSGLPPDLVRPGATLPAVVRRSASSARRTSWGRDARQCGTKRVSEWAVWTTSSESTGSAQSQAIPSPGKRIFL